MDPKFNGSHLSIEQENAEKWISNNYPEYFSAGIAFKINDDEFFSKAMW